MSALDGGQDVGRWTLLMFIFFIPLLICMSLSLVMIWHFIFAKDKIFMHLKALSIIGVCAFCTTLFCYWYSEQWNYHFQWAHLSYAMVSLFWGQGNAAVYLLLLSRMRLIFHRSAYKSSRLVYMVFIFMIGFVYICQLYIAIMFICVLEGIVSLEIGIHHINWFVFLNKFRVFSDLIFVEFL